MGEQISLKVKRLPHFKGKLPSYETEGASGMDVRAQMDEKEVLHPGKRTLVPTGLSFEIPSRYEIQVRPRSGWAHKKGISVINSPGTIDSDYRGELKILIINHGKEPVEIQDQDRIAQIVLCPVFKVKWEPVEETEKTKRGVGGFGSTGLNA